MAAKKKIDFNLDELLSRRSKEKIKEQNAETEQETTEENEQQEKVFKVDVYNLIPSKENFYHVDDTLKRSIEMVGFLQPCLVKKSRGRKYRVIAGHRRRLAAMALTEEGKEQFRYVPCILQKDALKVETEGRSGIIDKLTIISANGFRDKTDFEKMTEIMELKEIAKELKEEYSLPGRVREWQIELTEFLGITGTKAAQIARYEAIYNNLEEELMREFESGRLIFSVAVEVAKMERDWQLKAYDKLLENGDLSLAEVKQLKKQMEAEKQCPGQMELPDVQQEETEAGTEKEATTEESKQETITSLCYSCDKYETCNEKRATTTKCNVYTDHEAMNTTEKEGGQWEEEPCPETITSICYSCDKYKTCKDRSDIVTRCDVYANNKGLELTEEEKYNMEQAAIDRETKKKLQEKAQEEKMQNLPGDTRKKKYIRISRTQHKEIEEGQKPYIILKSAEHFNTGDIITAQVFEGGRSTGEVTELYITCLDDENTSSAINSGYVIAGILKKEVAADLGLLEDVEE